MKSRDPRVECVTCFVEFMNRKGCREKKRKACARSFRINITLCSINLVIRVCNIGDPARTRPKRLIIDEELPWVVKDKVIGTLG